MSSSFVQRLQKHSASQPKRSRIRPLSQVLVSASQAASKYQTPIPAPSRRSSKNLKAAENWNEMRDAIGADIEVKREPEPEALSSPSLSSTGPSASAGTSAEPHCSTPDTDVEMAPCEEKVAVDLPSSASGCLTPSWRLPDHHTLVAYSKLHQARFDALGLSWGVQWEVARIASLPGVGWDAIRLDALQKLCGTSAEMAPRVLHVLLGDHPLYHQLRISEGIIRPTSHTSPWEEYDKEEESIRDGSTTRLGGGGGYFGGKIDQILRISSKKGRYDFTLEPPRKGKSFRFRRFTGSRRLIEVRFKIKEDNLRPDELIEFFTKEALVINGRVFRAFYAKENGVYLVETNEETFRPADDLFGDNHRLSFQDFIQWHNPLYANPKQPLPKWVSRFALGFSDSQPGISFAPSNIHFIEDIIAPGQTGNSAIMTDGAGYINWAALKQLTDVFGWTTVPVCVQARFGGSKGLFVQHPTDRGSSEEPRIYIRPSQVKVKLHPDPSRWCPSHRILDVLIRAPLSSQVQVETFDFKIQEYLRSADLIPFMREDREPLLWHTVYTQRKIEELKVRAIMPASMMRAQGLSKNNPNSGMPPNIETQALGLLQSGFKTNFFPLFKRLESIQKSLLFGIDEKCHVRIHDSVLAFVIPDPLGVLEEGEVFCGLSNPVRDSRTDQNIHCITGPVLVTRNPCILPSDVRKVLAVDSPDLWAAGYHNVIIFSTKGQSSQASILGGGDYDGDTVIMIWDSAIVGQFTNSDTYYPNVDVSQYFDSRKGLVGDISPYDHEPVINALLAPIAPTQVGMYGNWHAHAAKMCGLDHPETVRLGNIFTTCLDGQKTGLMLYKSVVGQDSTKWNNPDYRVPCKLTVIDELRDALDRHCRDVEETMKSLRPYIKLDSDLIAPYLEARASCEHVEARAAELKQITDFVDRMQDEYQSGQFSVFKRHGQPRFERKEGGKKHSPGEIQEADFAVSEVYKKDLPQTFLHINASWARQIAASYSYSRDKPADPKFTFIVAWNEICKIKAEARGQDQGGALSMVPQIGESFSISRGTRQGLEMIDSYDV